MADLHFAHNVDDLTNDANCCLLEIVQLSHCVRLSTQSALGRRTRVVKDWMWPVWITISRQSQEWYWTNLQMTIKLPLPATLDAHSAIILYDGHMRKWLNSICFRINIMRIWMASLIPESGHHSIHTSKLKSSKRKLSMAKNFRNSKIQNENENDSKIIKLYFKSEVIAY